MSVHDFGSFFQPKFDGLITEPSKLIGPEIQARSVPAERVVTPVNWDFCGIQIKHANDPLAEALTREGFYLFVDTNDWRWKNALGAWDRGNSREAVMWLDMLAKQKRLALSRVPAPEPIDPGVLEWLRRVTE